MSTRSSAANANAEAGPSRPTKIESPSEGSPLNNVEDVDEGKGGVSKNGLSVNEDGEVSKIPAFLTKLYNMVSDPTTDELIYWSNNGDSFFVPSSDQFAKSILPRFFKHSNFSSFVRQLNMYAFHKVPHVNVSALADNPTEELWEFINPLFKRGQPDLLGRIVRKQRQPGAPMATATPPLRSSGRTAPLATPGGSVQHLITDGTTTGEAGVGGMLIGPPGQQMMDLNALTNHLANIQRTQSNIATDLKALKASNEHLWREQIAAQETQKRHQETIDLIVSFLERLFGTDGEGLKGLKDAMRRSGMARNREDSAPEEGSARKRKRLMIGDGTEEEMEEIGRGVDPRLRRNRSSRQNLTAAASGGGPDSQRFTSLPSDGVPTPKSASTQPSSQTAASTGKSAHISPVPDQLDLQPNPHNALAPYMYPSHPGLSASPSQPLSPTSAATAATAAAFNLDPGILSTTIGSLLQSPAAAQMFLNSLNNSIQGQALTSPVPTRPMANHTTTAMQPHIGAGTAAGGAGAEDPTLALFSPLPHGDLIAHNDALLKTYADAAGMNGDVNKLQESIDELVRSMGLDVPNNGDGVGGAGTNGYFPDIGGGQGQMDQNGGGGGTTGQTPNMELPEGFDVDEFLRSLEKGDENLAGGQ